MPKLITETKELTLPSYPDSKVTVVSKPTWGSVSEIKPGDDPAKIAKEILPKLILDWNFTDASDNKLEVNMENIGKLPAEDVGYLMQEVTKTLDTTLKKSPSDESQASSKGKKSE